MLFAVFFYLSNKFIVIVIITIQGYLEIVGTATKIWCLHWCCTRFGFLLLLLSLLCLWPKHARNWTNWTWRRYKKHLCSSCIACRIWIYYYLPSRCWPKLHFSIFICTQNELTLTKKYHKLRLAFYWAGTAETNVVAFSVWHLRITFQTPKIAMALNI